MSRAQTKMPSGLVVVEEEREPDIQCPVCSEVVVEERVQYISADYDAIVSTRCKAGHIISQRHRDTA